MTERLVMLASWESPGFGDPAPCCPDDVHEWTYWRPHPNGVNDIRTCKRSYRDANGNEQRCPTSEWRPHRHWWTDELNPTKRRCRVPGCVTA